MAKGNSVDVAEEDVFELVDLRVPRSCGNICQHLAHRKKTTLRAIKDERVQVHLDTLEQKGMIERQTRLIAGKDFVEYVKTATAQPKKSLVPENASV